MLSGAPAFAQPSAANKPALLGTIGSWGVYKATQDSKIICYALTTPKMRDPASLRRDTAFFFITSRAHEGVYREVSIIAGMDISATPAPSLSLGSTSYALATNGKSIWMRDKSLSGSLIRDMQSSRTLLVRLHSTRGNSTVDSYDLTGLSSALNMMDSCGGPQIQPRESQPRSQNPAQNQTPATRGNGPSEACKRFPDLC